jgi:adenosine deaminase
MPEEQPGDLTPMAMNCTVQHEMFLAWQAAGFSEQQAFELVKTAFAAAFGARI